MSEILDTEATPNLITFPCDFSIKVFGAATPEFEVTILTIIQHHCPNLSENAIVQRNSKAGKYLALTICVHVDSQKQLDDIYRELSANPLVVMAL